ncbi:MAG TPA: shikimate kinase [Terriglobales bacterium]|nr:shikimate kinase [Terriglobales bacterium]
MPLLPLLPSPLVLVGFMGCGKSTVGRLLAGRLAWHFCDLDDRIEAAAGATIASIFASRGEPAFRELEFRALQLALAESRERPTVLALGGGTFAQPHNPGIIHNAGGATLFLEVPVEELLARCAGIANRPLFRDEASFHALYQHRLAFYRQAQYTVAASAPPAQVADRILAALGRPALLQTS